MLVLKSPLWKKKRHPNCPAFPTIVLTTGVAFETRKPSFEPREPAIRYNERGKQVSLYVFHIRVKTSSNILRPEIYFILSS
jgi:hypothetical protein